MGGGEIFILVIKLKDVSNLLSMWPRRDCIAAGIAIGCVSQKPGHSGLTKLELISST